MDTLAHEAEPGNVPLSFSTRCRVLTHLSEQAVHTFLTRQNTLSQLRLGLSPKITGAGMLMAASKTEQSRELEQLTSSYGLSCSTQPRAPQETRQYQENSERAGQRSFTGQAPPWQMSRGRAVSQQ